MSEQKENLDFGWPVAVAVIAVVAGVVTLARMDKLSDLSNLVSRIVSPTSNPPTLSPTLTPPTVESKVSSSPVIPVIPIAPSPKDVAKASSPLKQEEIEQVFKEFINAWQGKQLSRLKLHMSNDFKSMSYNTETDEVYGSCNYAQCLKEQQEIFSKSQQIAITVSDVRYEIEDNGTASVIYYQRYRSPSYESWGTNSFYFVKKDGKVKIFKEVFNRDGFKVY